MCLEWDGCRRMILEFRVAAGNSHSGILAKSIGSTLQLQAANVTLPLDQESDTRWGKRQLR